ncbi:MAG TPA: hypothetical protein VKB59_22450 [Micromonosporaceae bacterium]|nr:hypothetical protein [Micromonosporaceae bacterium]
MHLRRQDDRCGERDEPPSLGRVRGAALRRQPANRPVPQFASAFNRHDLALAVDQFGGHHEFTWKDPSDPKVLTLGEIHDHLASLYDLGVRLPATVTFEAAEYEPPDSDGHDRPAGSSVAFYSNGPHFWGKVGIDCASGKIGYMVIDEWTRAIAGHAPLGPSPSA